MPYFNNFYINILFIHIPKTGGTSLEIYFSDRFNIPLDYTSLYSTISNETLIDNIIINSSLQHMRYQTIIDYKSIFNINMENIYILTIVRNPYERLISDLFFFNKININTSKEETFKIIQEYLASDNQDNHNTPQYKFITTCDNELIPNIKILHTETLTLDMHNMGFTDFNNRCNCNAIKTDYYSYLNDDSIGWINSFYSMDFELFNYKKL